MALDEPWRMCPDGIEVRVRVTPRGGRDAVDGIDRPDASGPLVKLRVRVAPAAGAANKAVRRLLAEALGCPLSAVSLRTGATARVKVFRVEGLTPDDARAAFGDNRDGRA